MYVSYVGLCLRSESVGISTIWCRFACAWQILLACGIYLLKYNAGNENKIVYFAFEEKEIEETRGKVVQYIFT